jgi:phenylacetyl-CoA:acceptor oxidoreductase subunit 1
MARWGMVVDLRRCIGCETCSSACSQSNQISPSFWRKIFDCGIAENADGQRLFLPKSCMHCDTAPCLEVCPTGATFQRADKIIDISYEKCIGCSYCILACPYDVRVIFRNKNKFEQDNSMIRSRPGADPVDRKGVCTKCNFCASIIDSGLRRGLEPGKDEAATPVCVNSCSSDALKFGDLNDPDSSISKFIQDNKAIRLNEKQGTSPAVYYLVEDKWIIK